MMLARLSIEFFRLNHEYVCDVFSTLRYANRAKNIKNRAQINEDPKDALLRQLQKEMEELKRQLSEQGEESGSEEDEGSAGKRG